MGCAGPPHSQKCFNCFTTLLSELNFFHDIACNCFNCFTVLVPSCGLSELNFDADLSIDAEKSGPRPTGAFWQDLEGNPAVATSDRKLRSSGSDVENSDPRQLSPSSSLVPRPSPRPLRPPSLGSASPSSPSSPLPPLPLASLLPPPSPHPSPLLPSSLPAPPSPPPACPEALQSFRRAWTGAPKAHPPTASRSRQPEGGADPLGRASIEERGGGMKMAPRWPHLGAILGNRTNERRANNNSVRVEPCCRSSSRISMRSPMAFGSES